MSERIVAQLRRRGRFWTAEPVFPPPPNADASVRRQGSRRQLVLASNRVARGGESARDGDLVLVGATAARGSRGKHQGRAQILRRIGRAEVAADAIEALMLDRGLAREFTATLRREAKEVARHDPHADRRRDLRGLPTFTIDPESARDFDDAVSAERTERGLRVWVHIADVSAFVTERSPLDREARRRGTSVYVPGAVEPMLPQELSADACSLMPGRDRLAVTVELELADERVLASSFYRSTIRSDRRLHYDEVDRIFAGAERAGDPWGAALELAREAALALGAARAGRSGAVELDVPEPQIELGADGHVASISTRVQTESHRLIEHLMIAANEAVAELLQRGGTPCLYRVHERPRPQRVELLIEQLASLGVQTPPAPERVSPSQAGELVAVLARSIEAHLSRGEARVRRRQASGDSGGDGRGGGARGGGGGVRDGGGGAHGSGGGGARGGRRALTSLLLRSLQQAYYSPSNLGHAGLGSACYCHFTSPIRRYPDIVCHRALLAAVGAGERAPRAGELLELGEWSSGREREAMSIERDADDVARCFALEAALYEHGFDEIFVGEVGGLIGAGAFVAFDHAADEARALRYEGMLPVRRLRGGDGERDWWQLNEPGTILRAERSGESLRLGDAVRVRVGRVETLRGRVDLELAG